MSNIADKYSLEQLKLWRSALQIESGNDYRVGKESTLKIVKRELDLTGNRRSAINELTRIINARQEVSPGR